MLTLPFTQARIPVEGSRLISRQGPRVGRQTWHNGIDLGGVPIGTSVYPVASGTVNAICVFGENCCGYGNAVRVQHDDNLFTYYAHLDRIDVGIGQSVDSAEPLGTVGKTFGQKDPETDECMTQPMIEHLHFEIQHAGYPFSPRDYAARYDVLQVLAASGLRPGSGGLLVETEPFEYEDPVLAAATQKQAADYHEEIVGSPALRYGRWYTVGVPVAIAGGILAVVGGVAWVARKYRRRAP